MIDLRNVRDVGVYDTMLKEWVHVHHMRAMRALQGVWNNCRFEQEADVPGQHLIDRTFLPLMNGVVYIHPAT